MSDKPHFTTEGVPSRFSDRYLFIGGEADGQRMYVSESLPQVRIPIPRRPLIVENDSPFGASIEHEVYRRCRLACGEKQWIIYLLNRLPERDIIERLIAGYDGNSKERSTFSKVKETMGK